MFKNYFKIASRSLWKNKTFSIINIAGLAIGITCCLLITAFLYDELSYDRYSEHAKDLYRVELSVEDNGNSSHYSLVDVGVGEGLQNAFPEIVSFTRVVKTGNFYFKYGNKQFKENDFAIADSNFLEMFSIPLLQGNAATALREPNSIIISEAYAKKYFGTEEALGKSITGVKTGRLLKVTGIFDKIPSNTHFSFDMILSSNGWGNQHTWSNIGYYTYLQLKPRTNPKTLESKFPQMVAKYVVPEVQHDMGVSLAEAQKSVNTFIFRLKPVTGIHLYSNNKDEIGINGNIKYIYIFSLLAIFILALACVNFTNLSTASSLSRSKEVGVRKVLGSSKKQLIGQFLTESVLLSFLALSVALIGVFVLLPYFNNLAGKSISFCFFISPAVICFTLVGCFIIGIIAGIYPAFFISSFDTNKILKSASSSVTRSRSGLRRGLVVFQFAVSIALIIATVVVYEQLRYMQNINLGFDKEQLVVLNDTYLLNGNEKSFADRLRQDTRVSGVTVSYTVPVNGAMSGTQVFAKENKENEAHSEIHMNIFNVDNNYVSTFGMQIVQGRNFSPSFGTDSSGVLINESAVRDLGWSHINPIGRTIVRSGQHEYHVVGVVKDFHYASARDQIEPMMMELGNNSGNIIVKVKTTNLRGFLANIKQQWNTYGAGAPFSYTFLDERFANVYAAEERTGQIFTLFAILSISIAGLGLFGLSAYSIRQRTKEIGVRKVLGANTNTILLLVSKEYVYIVLIAFAVAVPLTWFAMNQWLQDFAYRISISIWIFLAAGASALLLALLTVSFQAIKAAIANPVKSLRTE